MKRVTLTVLCSLFLVLMFISNSFAQMGSMMGEQKGKMHMGMMGSSDPKAKLVCAEQWLKKAIELHELHMKDPKTTTDASQMELMEQIKKAYGCITENSSEPESAPEKGSAREKKKDAHNH